jgi:hypothetical protein
MQPLVLSITNETLNSVLSYCREPKTKHAVKDHFGFGSKKLNKVLDVLYFSGYLKCDIEPRGRHRQQIKTTTNGRVYLESQGLRF